MRLFPALLLLACAAFPTLGFAATRITLLTSIDTSKIDAWFFMRSYYDTYEQRLEELFRERLAEKVPETNRLQIVVKHRADQFDLWTALHDPENHAVFWLSHAGGAGGVDSPGLSAPGAVVDFRGFDVAPLFAHVHPGLRFLGLIGCSASQVAAIQNLLKEKNASLDVYSFSETVDAKKGIKKALHRYRKLIDADGGANTPAYVCPLRKGYQMTVARSLPGKGAKRFPSVRLENRGQLLGVFPHGEAGEVQTLAVYLDFDAAEFKALDLKLISNAGANPMVTANEIELGAFQFFPSWTGSHWNLFADREGKPFGVVTHIYRYDGEIPSSLALGEPVSYKPFQCK